VPILPKERDPRLITVRRGGTLTDEHHRLLADWASCAPSTCCICSRIISQVTAGPARLSMPAGPGSAVRCVWVTHTGRLSGRMRQPAGCPVQRSSLHCRRARRLRWLTSPPMTWALRRTPSGRPAHASQPATLPGPGPGNGSGSGRTSLPLPANWFSTISNAGAPSAGTSSTTDLKPATHPLLPPTVCLRYGSRRNPGPCVYRSGALRVTPCEGASPPQRGGIRHGCRLGTGATRRRWAGRPWWHCVRDGGGAG